MLPTSKPTAIRHGAVPAGSKGVAALMATAMTSKTPQPAVDADQLVGTEETKPERSVGAVAVRLDPRHRVAEPVSRAAVGDACAAPASP